MKKNLIVIILCLLFVISGIASAVTNVNTEKKDIKNSEPDSRIFVIGIMDKMDSTDTTIDYEVLVFAWLIEAGVHKLNDGEMVRLYSPAIIIDFFNLVIGFCDDWSIIG